MSNVWPTTTLDSEEAIVEILTDLKGKRWLCCGQSECYGALVPSIDRPPRDRLSRIQNLELERKSIDRFRSTARFFSHPGEELALTDDIATLMVLQHYGLPTRLLDWSQSPWVAAYFAVEKDDTKDCEIWTFDEPLYEVAGRIQWKWWPETTTDGSGDPDKFDAKLTAFIRDDPPDWFMCGYYQPGFPRQNVQAGVWTLTARFGRDHAAAIAGLLGDSALYKKYVLKCNAKASFREYLRKAHGIWRGSLFPDTAGAAETARRVFDGGTL